MRTYDFDKTIFYPDSSACFYRFCLLRHPAALLPTLPGTIRSYIAYRHGAKSAKELKQQLFSFLPAVRDIDGTVSSFWKKNEKRLGAWYLAQKRGDDLILSASPRFLLQPICDKLGVTLIATEMDRHTGKINGLNCHDHEKVRRFYEQFPDGHTEAFYSDSLSDSPMAEIADAAFLVKRHKLLPWPGKK